MFTKRTIKPHQAVAAVDTASEALAVSISEKACVDMSYMSRLTGKTKMCIRDSYYRDNPLVQKAVKELAAAMPEMEVLGADEIGRAHV